MTTRRVGIVMEPQETDEAKGVRIRRTIGSEKLVLLDPFLLLDHLTVPPTGGEINAVGFPRHPHRGIETLTYAFTGRVQHTDSKGHDDIINTPGSQWMTAGSGIFHSEMFEAGAEGCEGLQIWFNLPAALKTARPDYHPAQPDALGVAHLDGGATAHVVAGELGGVKGPFQEIAVRPLYADIYLPAGATVTLPAPTGETTFAYLYRGAATFGEGAGNDTQSVEAARLVILCDGEGVTVQATGTEEARFIFVSARPLGEPVVQYRSLVLNTVEQVRQAIDDLEAGVFDKER